MGDLRFRDWRGRVRLTAALLVASAVGLAFVAARVAWTGRLGYSFMVKNLILAWIPFACALGASLALRARPAVLALWALAWLVFFPNAPYLMTDLVHFRAPGNPLWWYDATALAFFAWLGLALGFASLFLMQHTLAQRLGRAPAWALAGLALLLGAFGMQLGRFGRFNSWDVLTRPAGLAAEIGDTLLRPRGNLRELAFVAVVAVGLAAAYAVHLAFVHLLRDASGATEPRPTG